MNLTDEELTKLEEVKGSPEWNNIVAEITQIRQGVYPPDWGEKSDPWDIARSEF